MSINQRSQNSHYNHCDCYQNARLYGIHLALLDSLG